MPSPEPSATPAGFEPRRPALLAISGALSALTAVLAVLLGVVLSH